MNARILRLRGATLLLAALTLGCSAQPHAADESVADKLVAAALDAWQAGKTPDSIANEVRVVDPRWSAAAKLTKYILAPSASASQGHDVRRTATLWLVDNKGMEVVEDAEYTVSTQPPVVRRGADGW